MQDLVPHPSQPGPGPAAAPVISMATSAWEELDGGLGSCQALEDHSALAEPQEDRAPGTLVVLAGGGPSLMVPVSQEAHLQRPELLSLPHWTGLNCAPQVQPPALICLRGL